MIANMTNGMQIPRGAGFTTIIRTIRLSPPTLKTVVLVGESTLLNLMMNTFYRIYPNIRDSFVLVSSMAEAERIILESRHDDDLEKTRDRKSFESR